MNADFLPRKSAENTEIRCTGTTQTQSAHGTHGRTRKGKIRKIIGGKIIFGQDYRAD